MNKYFKFAALIEKDLTKFDVKKGVTPFFCWYYDLNDLSCKATIPQKEKKKQLNINLEAVKDVETQINYATKISDQLRNFGEQDMDLEWHYVIYVIKEIAE